MMKIELGERPTDLELKKIGNEEVVEEIRQIFGI